MFIDTNVFLRHLLNDHPQHSARAFGLISAIERGDVTAWTTDLAVAELVFVLSSKRTYNLDRQAISDLLVPLLDLSGLRLERKRMYVRVFELYVSLPIDFIDAYHAALLESRGDTALYSFDTDFDLVPGLRRHEP